MVFLIQLIPEEQIETLFCPFFLLFCLLFKIKTNGMSWNRVVSDVGGGGTEVLIRLFVLFFFSSHFSKLTKNKITECIDV